MTLKKKLELGKQFRTFNVRSDSVNEEDRSVELSFSSETPVKRYWGHEILSHKEGEVDLTRLNNSGPFLMDHRTSDQRGVIERAWVDQKGRALVRLSKNERGEELLNDIRDGIRTKISVGYELTELLDAWEEDGEEYYRFAWAPYEISSVAVEADVNVGVGRSEDDTTKKQFIVQKREKTMDEDEVLEGQEQEVEAGEEGARSGAPSDKPKVTVDVSAAVEAERKRCEEINAIGAQFGMQKEATAAIRANKPLDAFKSDVLQAVRTNKAKPAGTDMELGLDSQDLKRYSLMNAVKANVTGNWRKAGFEREVSQAIAEKMGKDARGFYVNYEVLAGMGGTRTNSKSTGVGAELVATDLWSDQFIDLLRPNSLAAKLGVRVATGLIGDVDIPKKTSGASFYWIDEDEDVTDSNLGLGIVKMSPKTIAGSIPITRRLMQQSTPDIDLLARNDLMEGLGLGIDTAIFMGTGLNNQPLGIKNQTGVNAITVPAGGFDWGSLVDFETEIAEANALADYIAYLMRPSTRGYLKKTEKSAGTAKYLYEDNEVNGYKADVSTIFDNDAILAGDFSQALLGVWGALDLMVDKSTKAASGGTVLRVFQDADVAVRHPSAFAYGVKP